MLVVEEKTSFVESQIKEILYGVTGAPAVHGKRGPDGRVLVPADGQVHGIVLQELGYLMRSGEPDALDRMVGDADRLDAVAVLHDVEAMEESALLLTISWRREKSDASESLSSTQRHLDEEAVSRMDDEGGAAGSTVSPPRRAT